VEAQSSFISFLAGSLRGQSDLRTTSEVEYNQARAPTINPAGGETTRNSDQTRAHPNPSSRQRTKMSSRLFLHPISAADCRSTTPSLLLLSFGGVCIIIFTTQSTLNLRVLANKNNVHPAFTHAVEAEPGHHDVCVAVARGALPGQARNDVSEPVGSK
jgi:hypothetical protein